MTGSVFVYYWITFAVLVPVFSAVVFLLARKAGYFKDQDRLRYLALWAEVPDEEFKHLEPRVPALPEHTDKHRLGSKE